MEIISHGYAKGFGTIFGTGMWEDNYIPREDNGDGDLFGGGNGSGSSDDNWDSDYCDGWGDGSGNSLGNGKCY